MPGPPIPRRGLLIVIALVAAAGCIRLGVWQLDRLAARRAFNSAALARLTEPAVAPAELPRDTALAHWRRVRVPAVPGEAPVLFHATRTRGGSPGVHVLRAVPFAGDTVVVVNTGWAYAADARIPPDSAWQSDAPAAGVAWVSTFEQGVRDSVVGRTVRRLDRAAVERAWGRPVAPFVLVLTAPPAPRDTPARLGDPTLGEGPHLSYAVQWFAFAAVAVGGTALVLLRGRGRTAE
jgi:surfeit locus 1 family protein